MIDRTRLGAPFKHTNAPFVLAHAGVDADGGEVAVHQQLVEGVGALHLLSVLWDGCRG